MKEFLIAFGAEYRSASFPPRKRVVIGLIDQRAFQSATAGKNRHGEILMNPGTHTADDISKITGNWTVERIVEARSRFISSGGKIVINRDALSRFSQNFEAEQAKGSMRVAKK